LGTAHFFISALLALIEGRKGKRKGHDDRAHLAPSLPCHAIPTRSFAASQKNCKGSPGGGGRLSSGVLIAVIAITPVEIGGTEFTISPPNRPMIPKL
jgi:hypothetical protein